MVDEPFFYDRIGRDYVECSRWRTDAVARVAAIKPDVLLLGSAYEYPFSESQWREGTARSLQPLSAVAGDIHIIRATPVLPFNGPECLTPKRWTIDQMSAENRYEARADSAQADTVYRSLQRAASDFANVYVGDMNDVVCPEARCSAERDDYIVFRDAQHLSARFVASLADEFGRRLDSTRSQQMPPAQDAE